MAFLLALALVVSVMSGLGLSVSAEQESNTPGTEEVQQQDKTEAGAAPSEVKAEEEAAKPEEKPVLEEKEDEQKKQEETKTDDGAKDDANAQDGDQKDKPQAEPAADDQNEPVGELTRNNLMAAPSNNEKVSEYTITCGEQKLTVKLVDESNNSIQGFRPDTLTINKDTPQDVENYAAKVEGYTYSSAYYGSSKSGVSQIAYYDNYSYWGNRYTGWYSVNSWGFGVSCDEISGNTIYLVYEKNPGFTIHFVDQDGNKIAEPETKNCEENITFADYKIDIPNHTYWRACYNHENDAEVTTATQSRPGSNQYTFYNGGTKLSKPGNSTGMTGESISKLTDIYLVYVKNGGEPSPGGTTGGSGTATATNTKGAWLNEDGTYDLKLTVSGSVGTSENKAIVDVIYVLDLSGSMKKSISGGSTRLEAAVQAIKTMTNSLAGNTKIDAKFSLVTFSYTASTKQGWTNSAATLRNAMNGLRPDGATNYEAAFSEAKSLLSNARSNASKVVVFLSDGDPTAYGNGNYGGGNNDSDGRAMSKARGVVKTMTPNYLFAVGVGPTENYSKLGKVTDAAHSGVQTEIFAGTDTAALQNAFKKMEGTITSVACEDVVINDTLSENVEMVLKENDTPEKLTGTITGAKPGDVTYNTDGTITLAATALNGETTLSAPTYNAGKIKWEFPAGYKLESDYTYTVTAKVAVTEKAYQNYRANGYTDRADMGTGTHEGEMGLYSNVNEEATLTYKQTGKDTTITVNYAKPVVRLTPSKLTIKKTVTGLDEIALGKLKDSLKFKVTYTYKDKTTTEKEISFRDFTLSDGTYSYTSDTLDCWSMDASYVVEETGYQVDNYDWTTSSISKEGNIIGQNQSEVVEFTNAYTPSDRTITLKKVVTGNMGDKNQSFTFSATNATLGETSLKDGGTTTITAKVGATVTITEDDYTNDGYTTTASATDDVKDGKYENHSYTFTVTKDMSESTIITFTNTKTIQPPNGITTTIAPYAIMVVLAAGAGVYFVYSRRRRNH